eukprot:9494473-Pyramimonas_sp.AAC.1
MGGHASTQTRLSLQTPLPRSAQCVLETLRRVKRCGFCSAATNAALSAGAAMRARGERQAGARRGGPACNMLRARHHCGGMPAR